MRVSPPPYVSCSQPPTEADCAQAARMADLLGHLIQECNARLATLDTAATADGTIETARIIGVLSREMRSELRELQGMQDRLFRRFHTIGTTSTALPSA